MEHSEKTKEKIRIFRLGKKHSEETKRKISKGFLGKRLSPEHRQKISQSKKGFKHSNETKKIISEKAKLRNQEKILDLSSVDYFRSIAILQELDDAQNL